MQPIVPKTRLTAKLVNEIIAQANRGGRITSGAGILTRNGPGGSTLSEDPVASLLTEPAHEVLVMNEGTTAIAALSPAGIVKSLGQSDGELYTERVLRVRPPKSEDAGNFVIAQDEIPPGGIGWAWCGGTCLVRLFRWFASDQLESADIVAGQRYALATVGGSLDILWSQRTADTIPAPIVGTEHLAIVRFNQRRFHLWLNGGTTTAAYGAPIVPKVTDSSGVVSGARFGVLSCRLPLTADSKMLSYVNIGGDVAAGEYGRCTSSDALVRTSASYSAGLVVGPESAQTSMTSAGGGFVVMARLGSYLSVQYAIAKVSPGSTQQYRLEIVGGNTLNDGVTAGIVYTQTEPTTVPTLYNPNIDTTFVTGIGRATLYINNVAQSDLVLVAHYAGTSSPLVRALVINQVVPTSAYTITLPLSGDATQTVTLYVPAAQA